MDRHYPPIASQPMRSGAVVRQPVLGPAAAITLEDPALAIMTDLRRIAPVLVDPEIDIEAAMRIMVRRNVRSLFVVNVEGEVLGLVTATDFLGEKPLQHIQQHGGRRSDIRVRDLMTPRARLEVLPMAQVARSRVGHVLASLARAGRQHAMAVEDEAGGVQVVRGVFSASRIEAQLGRPVSVGPRAHSFADIEAALAR
jgi:CBS domain-containing protein